MQFSQYSRLKTQDSYEVFPIAKLFLILCLCFFNAQEALAEHAPKSIAGFTLGDPLIKYTDKINAESTQCVRYQDYLNEVEIIEPQGYKAGLLCTGNCADPGKVIRIKLKYSNSSKKFFDKLLKRYKKKFGNPDEWKGDAFGVVHAWKWSFKDDEDNKISLTLQHNSEDHEMKMGNSVKLTMTSAIEKEKSCYEEQEKRSLKQSPNPSKKQKQVKPNWDMLLPE